MPQTTYSTIIGDVVAATLPNVRQEVVDNIHKKSVYLAKMMINSRRRSDQGGTDIRRSVEYGRNGSTMSFDGYDVVPRVPQETVTDCIWAWKNYASNWVVAWTEEMANKGPAKIRDVVTQKKTSMETSMNEEINTDLLNPTSFTTVGNSNKDFTPLSMIVSLDTTITVGQISETTNPWWAPQRKQSASHGGALAGSKFLAELRNMYNLCGKNKDGFPDLGVWSQELYELYESILDNKVRYGSTEMASLGFDTVMLKNMEICWDQIMPKTNDAGNAFMAYDDATVTNEHCGFFLNTKFLYFIYDKDADFVMTPAVKHEQAGQYATSGSMLYRAEHLCTNRRAQGVLHGVDPVQITLTT